MNNRSTLASGSRSRSGHRYRDDNEPFAHADSGSRSFPPSNHRFASAAGAGAAGYGEHGDGGHHAADDAHYGGTDYDNSAWTADNDWSQQDSWSDGGAWASDSGVWASNGGAWASNDAWTPDADVTWSPETDDPWAPEADASWSSEGDQTWTPDSEGWAPDADESGAGPTVIPGRSSNRRGGAHRMPAPPASLKGRAAVVAVAAGAVVAAGQAAMASPEQPSHSIDYEAAGQIHEIAAQSVSLADPDIAPNSPQVLNVSAPGNLDQFNDILQKGQKYAEELAASEAAKLRPLFSKFFAAGNFTSGFGARWGVQHLGVDIAGPIGTPIYAVADGTVIESGPAAGFGMWVRLLHDDGTVTIYGHIDTSTVSQGQRVMAGDQIATMGNRGFSTGPHVHFEVWLNGVDKVDPLPWLATRGISLGVRRD
ncbi:M23 family metallopeptidase [Nocardia sp. NPDC050710]|uniref:M23 family metallopeptidase n=1 Tax=Nocardia sp. NPDC050710 TaxID=3157220 RepID=UPI0033D221BE